MDAFHLFIIKRPKEKEREKEMGRAPCCDNMGLRRGPWTPEEDQILISHIQRYGHGNWRAIPKQAGLFRCGKSCRLRWANDLRPGIKRGNFTKNEVDAVISLHAVLGSRWSAIAAKLPGRTDNEIKNLWHGHLKKRFDPNQNMKDAKQKNRGNSKAKEFKQATLEGNVSSACSTTNDRDISSSVISTVGGENNSETNMNYQLLQFDDSPCWFEPQSITKNCSLNEIFIPDDFNPMSFYNGEGSNFWMNMLGKAANLQDWQNM